MSVESCALLNFQLRLLGCDVNVKLFALLAGHSSSARFSGNSRSSFISVRIPCAFLIRRIGLAVRRKVQRAFLFAYHRIMGGRKNVPRSQRNRDKDRSTPLVAPATPSRVIRPSSSVRVAVSNVQAGVYDLLAGEGAGPSKTRRYFLVRSPGGGWRR